MKTIYSFAMAALLSTAAVAQTQLQQSVPQSVPTTQMQNLQQAPATSKLNNMENKAASVANGSNIAGIQKAVDNAKASLQKLPNDMGGHRTKAVAALTNAQNELNQASKWAADHAKGVTKPVQK